MPCDQIRTYAVEAGKMNAEVLVAALNAIGWRAYATASRVYFTTSDGYSQGSYNPATGRLELPQGVQVEQVKVAYSKEVVAQSARRMGWQVQKSAAAPNRITLKRRV